jgi:hypothetical protein
MRLAAVRRGNRWPNRLLIRLVEKVARMELPDVTRAMSYRSGFFGGPYAAFLWQVSGSVTWALGVVAPGRAEVFSMACGRRLARCSLAT